LHVGKVARVADRWELITGWYLVLYVKNFLGVHRVLQRSGGEIDKVGPGKSVVEELLLDFCFCCQLPQTIDFSPFVRVIVDGQLLNVTELGRGDTLEGRGFGGLWSWDLVGYRRVRVIVWWFVVVRVFFFRTAMQT